MNPANKLRQFVSGLRHAFSKTQKRRRLSRRLHVELLETRWVLAGNGVAFFVNGYTGGAIPEQVRDDLEYLVNADKVAGSPSGINWDRDNDGKNDIYETNWNSPDPTYESGNPNHGTDTAFVNALIKILGTYDKDDVVIVVGHSFGGDSVLKAVSNLRSSIVEVDLLAVLDPVSFAGVRGGFATFDSQVEYFYNRWQTNYAFPLNYGDSGHIDAAGTKSLEADFNISSQAEQSTSRLPDGSVYEHGCNEIDVLALTCQQKLITPKLPDLPYTKFFSTALHHGALPNDGFIQQQLYTIIEGIIPAPPVVDAGAPRTINEGDRLTLNGMANDANPGDSLTYQWTRTSGPTVSISNDNSLAPSILFEDDGSYTFRLTAIDSSGLVSSDTVTITVRNLPPTVTAVSGPSPWVRGLPLTLTTEFSDAGIFDQHQVRWSFGDGMTRNFTTSRSPGNISHAYGDRGSFNATATVRDFDGGSGTGTRTIVVNAAGLIPNPINPALNDLVVGGSPSSDNLVISNVVNSSAFDIFVDNIYDRRLIPTGDIRIFGAGGNDVLVVNNLLTGRSIDIGEVFAGVPGSVAPPGTVLVKNELGPGMMIVKNLTLRQVARLEQQIYGSSSGTGFDQIIVTGNVILNNPTLTLEAMFAAPAGSEFVIIKNNGTQAVSGKFRDTNGVVLNDGAIVSTNFGNTGRTARISYAGGDGNDVVILVDGAYTFNSPLDGVATDLRVVANNGIAQFYVGGVLRQARTLAGLDQLFVQGEAGNVDRVQIDFGGGNPIPSGGISLSTGTDTTDILTVLGGSASSVVHTLVDASISTIAITSGGTTRNVTYTKLARVNDNLTAAARSFITTAQATTATLSNSGVAGTTRLTANGSQTIDFANPTVSLELTAGTAADAVTVSGLGSGFIASLNINTGAGVDSVTIAGGLSGLSNLALVSAAINLASPAISTTGTQIYSGPVKVNNAATLTGSGLRFNGTLDALTNSVDLVLNTTGGGTTSLLAAVGGTTPFRNLTTNSDGTTAIAGSINAANGLISLNDPVTLLSDASISSTGGVTFGSTLGGAFSATVNAGGTATITNLVTGINNLNVTAGRIDLNASAISTTGAQSYRGPTVIGATQTLTGSQLRFESTLDAAVDELSLTLNSIGGGVTSLLGSVGAIRPLKTLTTNLDGTTSLGTNVIVGGGSLTFGDNVNLTAASSITNSGTGVVTLAGAVDGAFNLRLAVAGSTRFNGSVGATVPAGNSAGPAFDIISTGKTLFTKSVKTASHFIQRDTAGEVTFQENVAIGAGTTNSIFDGNVVLDGLTFGSASGVVFGNAATDLVLLSTADVTFDFASSAVGTFNGAITGTNGLIKTGAGTLAIKAAATYQGNTQISAGSVTRSAVNQLPDTTRLIVDTGATFEMQDLNEVIAGVSGGGNVVLGTATLSLANANDTFSGVISDAGKMVLLAGTQTLTGANTYTGTTTITSGELQLNGGKIGASTAAATVTIASGAVLSGQGSINAPINGLGNSTIRSTGDFLIGLASVTTGFSTVGALNIGPTGTLTLLDKDAPTIGGNVFVAGGTLAMAQAFSMGAGQTLSGVGTIRAADGVMNLSGAVLRPTGILTTPGFQLSSASTFEVSVGATQIVATGSVSLNGSQLVIKAPTPYTHINGKQSVLIDNDGTDPVVGEFANYGQGQEFDFGSEKFSRIYYKSNVPGISNDVVVKATEYVATPTVVAIDGRGFSVWADFATNDRGNTVYVYPGAGASTLAYAVYGPQGKVLRSVREMGVTTVGEGVYGPKIVTRPDGGYAVTALGSFETHYVFWLDANGNPDGAPLEYKITPESNLGSVGADRVGIAFSNDGSFILAWGETLLSTSSNRLVFQRYDAQRRPLDAVPIPVTQYQKEFQNPEITVLRDGPGNTYIAWGEYTGTGFGQNIKVRRITPDGRLMGSQPTVIASNADGINTFSDRLLGPALDINAAGKLVFAYGWNRISAGPLSDITVKQLASDLTTISQHTVQLRDGTSLSLAINELGNYALAYTDYTPSSEYVQKVAWFAPDGKLRFVVSRNEPLNYPSRLSLANDGSVVLGGLEGNDKFRTRAYGEPTDVIAGALSTNLTSTITLPYDLRFGSSGPLRARFYKSVDAIVDATDEVLTTMEFSGAPDLTPGRKVKTLTIGSGSGEVPLPGNGLPATTVDYYILAMLDPDDDLFELDVDSPSSDNVSSYFVHFNDAPVVAGLSGITYTENAAGLPIAPAGTVFDADAVQVGYTDFRGGAMTVTLATNSSVDDRLGITNQGTGAGQVSVTGTKLFHAGVEIGTFTGGSGSTPLVITFTTPAATPVAAQAVLRAITFRTLGELPSTTLRTLTVSLTDGDGGTGSVVTQNISVASVPDAPVIGAFGSTITYTENAAQLLLNITATLVDIDSADFDGGSLTATLTVNREATDILSIKPMGTGATAVTISGNAVSVGGTIIGTFSVSATTGALTFNFNNKATQATVQPLIRAIAYQSISENPSVATRTVQLVMTDGDGGTSSAVSKSIIVRGVNDNPIVSSLGLPFIYSAGDNPVFVASGTTISDIDSANFDSGKLTVRISANSQSTDRLSILNSGTGATRLSTTADFKVFRGSNQIGTFAGGIGSTPLVVTFNAGVTPAISQQVLSAIQFSSTSTTPALLPRTIAVTLTDGDGGTSAAVNRTVNINDDPVITNFGGAISYARTGTARLITTTASITDASANFDGGLLTFALTASDGKDLLSIKTNAALTIANSNEIFLNGLKIGSFTGGRNNVNLVIALTSNATAARVTSLLKAIQFSSTTTAATPPVRGLKVTLADGKGGVSATASKSIAIT